MPPVVLKLNHHASTCRTPPLLHVLTMVYIKILFEYQRSTILHLWLLDLSTHHHFFYYSSSDIMAHRNKKLAKGLARLSDDREDMSVVDKASDMDDIIA